ncbi:hypothetical protein GGI04_002130 [Coemansia thaxteri]|nr:hypothetical protein GGI04_002130 [Coemansia thaxteri]
MEASDKDLALEAGAFRIDVCGHQLSVAAEQTAAAGDIDRALAQLVQPAAPRLRAHVAAAAAAAAAAMDAQAGEGRTPAALARLRRTRRRESAALAGALYGDGDGDLAVGAVRDALEAAARAAQLAGGGAARGLHVTAEAGAGGAFRLGGAGGGAAAVVGVVARARDAMAPFASGVAERVAAAVNRHARRHPEARHAWAVVAACGVVRVCVAEPDAIHVGGPMRVATAAGRRRLAAFVAAVALAEDWRLGADPTMRWSAAAARWEVDVPGGADGAEPPVTVYAQPPLLFAADAFFGRFTRCFAASLDPAGAATHVLKDSWQLVDNAEDGADGPAGDADEPAVGADEPAVDDEIATLARIRTAMDADGAASRVAYQRLVCGGTVRVGGARDTTRVVLGALDAYARWTVPHGARRGRMHRVHRRMVTGPVGVGLATLHRERDAVRAVADAMAAHAEILRVAGVLHRDVSLGNIVALQPSQSSDQPSGRSSVRGMLIDFDHALDPAHERNARRPGHVGTAPFMSIASLEGLDVPRTAADDWEAALALLLCLAARPALRDALCHRLAAVGSAGLADWRRDLFASRAAFESAASRFADPACPCALRLARALHAALFAHPSCPGTTRRLLRGDRIVDPILRRAHHADAIHARCLAAVTAYIAEDDTADEKPEEPANGKASGPLTCSDDDTMAVFISPPVLPYHPRNKRKALVDVEASPRVKRRKMAHDEFGFGPENFAPPESSSIHSHSRADSSTVVGESTIDSSTTTKKHAPVVVIVQNERIPSSPKKRKLF